MSYVRVALVTVPAILFLGTVSASLSGSGEGSAWYAALAKPAATPPGWLFPVAWTLLYAMMGLALALIVSARGATGRGPAVALFTTQLLLNLAWSPVFFGAHRIRLALALLLAIVLLTIATILAFARIRRRAAWLMLPYLGWLCFAAWLNHRVDVLNPPLASPAGSTQVAL